MSKYVFSYDLHQQHNKDAWSLIDAEIARRFPVSKKALNTTFFIVSNDLIQTVSDALKLILDRHSSHHEFLVCLFSQYQGWLAPGKWDWVNNHQYA